MCTSRIVVIAILLALVTGGFVVGIFFALKYHCEAIEPPSDLKIQEEDEVLKVSWSEIPNACGKSHRVDEYYPDMVEPQSHITEDLFQYLEIPPYCINVHIAVVRLSDEDDRVSLGTSETFTKGRNSIKVPYLNLSEESGVLKAEWDAPENNLENCTDIVYELTSGGDHWETTSTSLEIQLSNYTGFIPCTIANFSIVPITNGERGSEMTEIYEIPLPDTFGAEFNHSSGLVSDNGDNFVSMEWELGDIGLCPIEYLVSCSYADTPAIEEQINTPSFDFKACPIVDIMSNITVIIRPLLPGISPDIDRDGQARICEFYVSNESRWMLTGDCTLLDKEQKLAQRRQLN